MELRSIPHGRAAVASGGWAGFSVGSRGNRVLWKPDDAGAVAKHCRPSDRRLASEACHRAESAQLEAIALFITAIDFSAGQHTCWPLVPSNVLAWLVAVSFSYGMNTFTTFGPEVRPHSALAGLCHLRRLRHCRHGVLDRDLVRFVLCTAGLGGQADIDSGQLCDQLLALALRRISSQARAIAASRPYNLGPLWVNVRHRPSGRYPPSVLVKPKFCPENRLPPAPLSSWSRASSPSSSAAAPALPSA